MSVSSSSAPQSSLPILLYPPKPGDDCQRGRKRRPAPATSVPYWGFICALRIPRSRRTCRPTRPLARLCGLTVYGTLPYTWLGREDI